MAESHYVVAKTNTPSRSGYIELSPKRKSKSKIDSRISQNQFQLQNSQPVVDSRNSYKENKSANFEIVNMPIRLQKPFQKIPKYNKQQVIVRSRTNYNLDSESKSRRKKIQVTKLQNEGNSKISMQGSPYISKFSDRLNE